MPSGTEERIECLNEVERKGEEASMAILINLNVMMAKRRIGLTELSDKVGVSLANLSILKNNRARAIRFTTLDAICKALDCQPGDILEFVDDGKSIVIEDED